MKNSHMCLLVQKVSQDRRHGGEITVLSSRDEHTKQLLKLLTARDCLTNKQDEHSRPCRRGENELWRVGGNGRIAAELLNDGGTASSRGVTSSGLGQTKVLSGDNLYGSTEEVIVARH